MAYDPMVGFKSDMWGGLPNQFLGNSPNPMQFMYPTPVGDAAGIPSVTSTAADAISGPSWWDKMVGGKNADGTSFNGWGGMAMGAIQGLGNAYMGMKQYGLAKEQLQFSKDSFERNFAAQRQMTNTNLMDRQRARVASNPGAYQSVGDYMNENGVK